VRSAGRRLRLGVVSSDPWSLERLSAEALAFKRCSRVPRRSARRVVPHFPPRNKGARVAPLTRLRRVIASLFQCVAAVLQGTVSQCVTEFPQPLSACRRFTAAAFCESAKFREACQCAVAVGRASVLKRICLFCNIAVAPISRAQPGSYLPRSGLPSKPNRARRHHSRKFAATHSDFAATTLSSFFRNSAAVLHPSWPRYAAARFF
jgi:hypothetical protein